MWILSHCTECYYELWIYAAAMEVCAVQASVIFELRTECFLPQRMKQVSLGVIICNGLISMATGLYPSPPPLCVSRYLSLLGRPSLSPPPYHCFFCVQTLLLLSGFFLFLCLSLSLSLTVSLSLPLFPSLAQCSYGCLLFVCVWEFWEMFPCTVRQPCGHNSSNQSHMCAPCPPPGSSLKGMVLHTAHQQVPKPSVCCPA